MTRIRYCFSASLKCWRCIDGAARGFNHCPTPAGGSPASAGAAIERVLALALAASWHVTRVADFSLIVEYVGIAFFWPEEGALHSKAVMETESRYFSEEFTRSLLLSDPVVTVECWLTLAYQWLFVDSGFLGWLNARADQGNDFTRTLNGGAAWLLVKLREYLLATVYVTLVFLIRVTILVLSVPLFVMVAAIGIVDGLVRRDLRRYGAAYESSFIYHHAKRWIKPATCLPCVIYLSMPFAVYPNILLLPAALLLGLVISLTTGAFKKYL